MQVKKNYYIIFVSIMIISLYSCSFDYEQSAIAENLDENIPDILMENAKLVFVRGTKVEITADRIEIYSKQQQQNMYNVNFKEVDRQDNIRMEGRSDQIAIETGSNNVTMIGNIIARSSRDEAEISTDYLYWNDGENVISGSNISPVAIKKDIGSEVSGYGFRGDAKKRILTIRGSAEGQLVVDE